MAGTKRILLLEDMEKWQKRVSKAIEPLGYPVDIAGDVKTAEALITQHVYHLFVLDLSMVIGDGSDEQGFNFLKDLRQIDWGRTAGVLIITAYPNIERVRMAFAEHKVDDFLFKSEWTRAGFLEKVVAVLNSPPSSLESRIQAGENETLEFKSTLRWNVHTNQRDKKIEHACLKTIAAFLNTRGGTLLIGVNDEGVAMGLEADKFNNMDTMTRYLENLIVKKIGMRFMGEYVTVSVETVAGKQVLQVDCKPSDEPAYIRDDAEEFFYIRTGSSSRDLGKSEIHEYINHHFPA